MTQPMNITRRAGGLLFVVGATAAGILAAAALASNAGLVSVHRATKRTGIAVFSHPPKLARIAKTGSLSAPSGAILAAISGENEVYALHDAGGEDCVMSLHVGAGGGSVCAPPRRVEEQGAVGIFEEGQGATAPDSPARLRVTVMVPNGVGSVQFTYRDDSTDQVTVSNNVAELESTEIASVSYPLPGGGSRTTNVAAVVDNAPSQPGAGGSSR